jgi:type II secretory ATPase GspE/PulE/Tfp pilus assembly ATPase PilB-like protein
MTSDRTFNPGPATITVGLVDGQSRTGRLLRFSPLEPEVTLGLPPPAGGKVSLAAERIAYIGFHTGPAVASHTESTGDISWKIHVSGARTFLVEPSDPVPATAIGFYARPRDPFSPFGEIFFYNHGVNLKEINRPLGEMLVRDGRIAAATLEKVLEAQKGQRRSTIGEILVEQRKVDQVAIERVAAAQGRKGTRIGEVLIEAGLVTAQDVELALSEQRRRGGKRVGQILIDMKMVSERDLSATLARKFQLPFIDLDDCSVSLAAVGELSREFIEKHRILPVASSPKTLTVAMGDPLAVDTIDLVRTRCSKQVCEVVVTPSQLDKYIPIYLAQIEPKATPNKLGDILKDLSEEKGHEISETGAGGPGQIGESDSAIIKLANQIIIDACHRGASDIHIEPNGKERKTVVRFRIDGDCVAYQEIPAAYRLPLVARLKIMAMLDIAERRKPQDGKILFRLDDTQVELRVAVLPTVNGNEDVVLRILAASEPIPLEKMSLSARNLTELGKVIRKPYGLILCVGPTGSGKTTTLHSALGAINTIDTKIWTAEDPVEITQHGLRQVQVSPKIGFTFAAAMRAFLRADPDVIMVGEMRDLETAETAIEASLTGHLVFSTLHTSTAPETVTRLIDMGIDPFTFADALLGVLAQRLARSLCKKCRKPFTPSESEIEELSRACGPERFDDLTRTLNPELKLWRPVGCDECGQSGYRGRVPLHELLIVDDVLKSRIQAKATVDELRRLAAKGGMTTLLQDGVEKVLLGVTDLKQVLAVCSRS